MTFFGWLLVLLLLLCRRRENILNNIVIKRCIYYCYLYYLYACAFLLCWCVGVLCVDDACDKSHLRWYAMQKEIEMSAIHWRLYLLQIWITFSPPPNNRVEWNDFHFGFSCCFAAISAIIHVRYSSWVFFDSSLNQTAQTCANAHRK